MNAAFVAGTSLVLHRRFVPDLILASIARERVTMFFAVPTIFINLLNGDLTRADLASIRYEFSAAATMPQEISRRWTERFRRPVFEGYGLTECSPFAAYNHDFRHKVGTVGSAVGERRDQDPGRAGSRGPARARGARSASRGRA